MPEILSQLEIDSLLSGMSSHEDTSATLRSPGKEAITFDFRLPHRLTKSHLRTLRAVHENFADSFATYLSSRLQVAVGIAVCSVDQLFYSDYVHAISNPSCLYVFRIKESEANAVLEFNPSLVLAMVEHLMGGETGEAKPSRQITRIEQNIVRSVVQRALTELQRAWKVAAELTFSLDRYESEPDLVQLTPPSEIVLVIPFDITIGNHKFSMNVCLPTSAIDEVLARLNLSAVSSAPPQPKENPWLGPIVKHLESTAVVVSAILGESTLTVREMLSLEPGDIVRTGIPIDNEVRLSIGGRTLMWGRPGVVHGKIAVKIVRTLSA